MSLEAVVQRFVANDLARVLTPFGQGVAYLLFSEAKESVEMIERVSGGALSASVIARCNDPALGGKMRVCVVRVERSEYDGTEGRARTQLAEVDVSDNDREPSTRRSLASTSGAAATAAAATYWRGRYGGKRPEQERQSAA